MKPESVKQGDRYGVPTFIHLKRPSVTVRERVAPNWFMVEYPNGDKVRVHYSDLNPIPAPRSPLPTRCGSAVKEYHDVWQLSRRH